MSLLPMSPIDAAWYHMDGPANRAMVTGMLLTKRPLDFARVRALFHRRLMRFERFGQRVVERGFPIAVPHWEDFEDFDLDAHLRPGALPASAGDDGLRALLAEFASTPLDPDLPLWQARVVELGGSGGSALVLRFHHCIGDGTAMMSVVSRLFDAAPARRGRRAHEAAHCVMPPALAADEPPLLDRAVQLVAGAGMLLHELLKPSDPPSPLKGEFGLRKQVAWSQPVAIADIKAIGAPHGAKVNDVLVAAVTGALRSYLKRRGIDVDRTTVRAMVPVDLRPPERLGELGNDFGLVVLDLAVDSARRSERLALTKSRMDALKQSAEPVAMRLLLELFGRGPKALEDVANDLFGSKASVVLTNVAGPRARLGLTGVPIERMLFWVPHPGRQLGVGISIMSYAGQATLAVIADAHLLPDPEAITTAFGREIDAMRRRVRAAGSRG